MALERPLKEGSVRTYQAKVGLGFVDILASEMDADLDTIYAAWNGGGGVPGGPAGGDLGSSYPNPIVVKSAGHFTVNGNLTATGTAHQIGTGAAVAHAINYGPRCVIATDLHALDILTNSSAALSYDVAIPSWHMQLTQSGGADRFLLERRPASSGTYAPLLAVDNAGNLTAVGPVHTFGASTGSYTAKLGPRGGLYSDVNQTELYANAPVAPNYDRNGQSSWLARVSASSDVFQLLRRTLGTDTFEEFLKLTSTADLTIQGSHAYKFGTTAWEALSDIRLKKDVAPYTAGLAQLLQLQPITYQYNGLGGSPDDGATYYGLSADDVQPILPECVGRQRVKLTPDDSEETEVLSLDASNIIWALVNAVKELSAKVSALESRA